MQEIVAPNPYTTSEINCYAYISSISLKRRRKNINHENQISHQEQDRCFTSNDMRFRNFLSLKSSMILKMISGKTSKEKCVANWCPLISFHLINNLEAIFLLILSLSYFNWSYITDLRNQFHFHWFDTFDWSFVYVIIS